MLVAQWASHLLGALSRYLGNASVCRAVGTRPDVSTFIREHSGELV